MQANHSTLNLNNLETVAAPRVTTTASVLAGIGLAIGAGLASIGALFASHLMILGGTATVIVTGALLGALWLIAPRGEGRIGPAIGCLAVAVASMLSVNASVFASTMAAAWIVFAVGHVFGPRMPALRFASIATAILQALLLCFFRDERDVALLLNLWCAGVASIGVISAHRYRAA